MRSSFKVVQFFHEGDESILGHIFGILNREASATGGKDDSNNVREKEASPRLI